MRPPRHKTRRRLCSLGRARTWAWTVGLAIVAVIAVGCGGDDSASPTAQATVPTPTQRVYRATALGCEFLGTDRAGGTEFTPLEVRGSGYSTTIEPTDGCRDQRIFSSYVYDVPA